MLYQPLPAIPLEKPLAGTFTGSLAGLGIPENPPANGGPAWRSGVALPSFIDLESGGWPGAPCLSAYETDWETALEDTFDLDDKANTYGDCVVNVFDPFTIYHMVDSVDGGELIGSEEQQARFRGYADNWLDAQVSAGIARAFYRGGPTDGLVVAGNTRNPIPRTAAVDLTALMGTPAAVHPTTAFSMLLDAYAGCRQAGGAIVHVPVRLLPFLIAHGVVAQVGQRFLGPGGITVVSDPGMPSDRNLFSDGAGSDSTVFPGTSIGETYDITDTQSWMFVTGPVRWAAGDVSVPLDGDAQVFDVRQNRWMYVVEQRAIFAWDTECAFAAAVFAPSPGPDEV